MDMFPFVFLSQYKQMLPPVLFLIIYCKCNFGIQDLRCLKQPAMAPRHFKLLLPDSSDFSAETTNMQIG